MVPTNYYVILSAILFGLGVFAFIFKRNVITIFMSIELMLNAVNLAFVAFSQALGNQRAFRCELAQQIRHRDGYQLDGTFLPLDPRSRPRIFRLLWTKSSAVPQGVFHLDHGGRFPRWLRLANGPAHRRHGAGSNWRRLAHPHLRYRLHGA